MIKQSGASECVSSAEQVNELAVLANKWADGWMAQYLQLNFRLFWTIVESWICDREHVIPEEKSIWMRVSRWKTSKTQGSQSHWERRKNSTLNITEEPPTENLGRPWKLSSSYNIFFSTSKPRYSAPIYRRILEIKNINFSLYIYFHSYLRI